MNNISIGKVKSWVTLQTAPHIEAQKIGNTVYVRGEVAALKEAASLWSLNSKDLIEKLDIPNTYNLKTQNLSFGNNDEKSFFLVELSV
jgi:hypothetical protein